MDIFDFREPHLRDSVKVFLRRWKIILGVILAAVLWVVIQSLNMYPLYQSTTIIQIDNGKAASINLNQPMVVFEYGGGDEKWVNTQMKILGSGVIAEGVVKKLGLQLQRNSEEKVYEILMRNWVPMGKYLVRKPSGIKIIPVTVEANAPQGTYRVIFSDNKKFRIYDHGDRLLGDGQIDQTFMGPSFSFLLQGKGSAGQSIEFQIVPNSSVTQAVQGNLAILQVKNSSLLNFTAKWTDPQRAKEIADAAVDVYRETLIKKRTTETSQVLAFIESQLAATEKDLRQAEENLSKFKNRENAVLFDSDAKIALERITDWEKEYRLLGSYRQQAEILLAALQNSARPFERKILISLGGLNDNYLPDLSRRLTSLYTEKAGITNTLKENHPKVKRINREIETVEKGIIQSVAKLISEVKGREETYKAGLKKLEEKVQRLPDLEREFFALERVVKVGQGMTSFLMQKKAELSINKAGVISNIQVIEPASLPTGYVEPNIPARILWALLIGGTFGISLIFFVEYFDKTLKAPEELKQITDLPCLGNIYHYLFSHDGHAARQELILLEAPLSLIAEGIRTIRTNLMYYAMLGEQKKFFLITSACPSEGRTFITANLGVALAQSGKRVLLAETDLRRPRLCEILEGTSSPGFSNVLLDGAIEYGRLPIQRTFQENLEFIAAGDKSPNPSELLSSDRMAIFFSGVKDHYDYVLLDSPPAFLTSDPLILSHRVDGVIFIVRSGEVKKDVFRETLANFQKLETKMVGIIFNDARRENGKFSDKYSDYYEDGNGQKKRGIRFLKQKIFFR